MLPTKSSSRTPLFFFLIPLAVFLGQMSSATAQPFASGADITMSADGAWSVYAADIDGDGDKDVLSASRFDDTVAWYQNGDVSGGGDGSSWTRNNISTSASRARGVYAADIDGDNDQDVLSASAGDNTVTLFQNGGDATGGGDGSSWTSTDITTSADGVHSVVAADVDGDGDLDVLSASRVDDTVAWYQNGDSNGGGDGSSWTRTNITTSADGAISVYTADIDGDGDQDVLSASNNDDTIAWYRNGDSNGGGDGSSWTTDLITTSAADANSVYSADIDGDDDMDVISGSFVDNTVAWHRNGDSSGGGDGSSWTTSDITTTAEGANRVFAADIDADGDQDVFSASTSDNTVAWYRNGDSAGGGDGSTWTDNTITTSADEARGLYVADIDGNDALDVLSASSNDDRVTWYRNKNTTIPVELAQFGVQKHAEEAVLAWQTASEQNNAGFEVQRRISGEWESISFIEGAGTTSKPQTYRFQDSELPFEAESVNYRLKQIDTDGSTSFSGTRTLKIGTPERIALHAPFPNPAQGRVTLRYALSRKADVSICIYDVMGREVTTFQRGTEDAGRKEIQVPASGLSAGVYFVRLQANDTVKTERLTVVK